MYAKRAFVLMSHAVMGQNDLEKLLQRVLNEVQYKKVRGFLDTEAQTLSSEIFSNIGAHRQADFVIKTAKNKGQALNVNNSTPTNAAMISVSTPGSI